MGCDGLASPQPDPAPIGDYHSFNGISFNAPRAASGHPDRMIGIRDTVLLSPRNTGVLATMARSIGMIAIGTGQGVEGAPLSERGRSESCMGSR